MTTEAETEEMELQNKDGQGRATRHWEMRKGPPTELPRGQDPSHCWVSELLASRIVRG